MRGKKTNNSSDIVCRDMLGSHYLCEIIFLREWQEGVPQREKKSKYKVLPLRDPKYILLYPVVCLYQRWYGELTFQKFGMRGLTNG